MVCLTHISVVGIVVGLYCHLSGLSSWSFDILGVRVLLSLSVLAGRWFDYYQMSDNSEAVTCVQLHWLYAPWSRCKVWFRRWNLTCFVYLCETSRTLDVSNVLFSGSQTFSDCGTPGNTHFYHGTLAFSMLDSSAVNHIFLAFWNFTHYTDCIHEQMDKRKFENDFKFDYTTHSFPHNEDVWGRRSLVTLARLGLKQLNVCPTWKVFMI